MTNVAQMLADSVAAHGDRPAIKLDDIVLSYTALDEASARAAGLLAGRGVGPGDSVGLMLPNLPYFPMLLFGALALGATVAPMNPLLKGREVAFHLSDSGSRHLFAWTGFAEPARAGCEDAGAECVLVAPGEFEPLLGAADAVRELADREAGDAAVIIYTSGTTGTPKGAELTHGNLSDAADVAVELVDLQPTSIGLGALPLFHVFGMNCVSGGAAIPVEVIRGFEETFGCKVLEGYGLSETCGMASFNRPDRERKAGSIGLPMRGVEMKVVDPDDGDLPQGEVGEIVLRSPHVMRGYHGRPDATAVVMRGGWFHTGDLAHVDEEGYFFIVDRKKDLIIRGGYNVYPREIEEVIYEHQAVLEAAVSRRGESRPPALAEPVTWNST